MVLNRRLPLLQLLLLVLLLSGCTGQGSRTGLFPGLDEEGAVLTMVPSPEPPRVLSICLGEEPESLFLYGDLSRSAEIIRQALYDGPIDRKGFQYSSPVLGQIPSLENALVKLGEVEVLPGERMVDARGNITILASGVEFRPAGCGSRDCWQIYTSQTSALLDQVSVTFPLREGLVWSDGSPLTAEDSLFSFRAAGEIYGTLGPAKHRYAADYKLNPDGDLEWLGLPGYQGIISYPELFFSPLPEHLWSNYAREELLTSAPTALSPIGWGPYKILEWIRGDHLTLEKNPLYAGTSSGLPAFDFLVFRFVKGGEEALAAFAADECQIVLNEPDLADYSAELEIGQDQGLLRLYFNQGSAWEQLSFGIEPLDRRSRILENAAVRQALARCLDREGITGMRLDAGSVVDGLYLDGDPRYSPAPEEKGIEYDPAEAGLALKDLGWVDQDGDPATPRLAVGVEGVPDETPLTLTLLAGDSDGVSSTLSQISQDLQGCGVGVEIQQLPTSELLAPGPEGPIFGRQFDLALFAWAAGNYQPCRLFLSEEIPGFYPGSPKGWGGVNASGFRDGDYDQACLAASTNLPDSDAAALAQVQLNLIFQEGLPAVPFFFRQEILVAKPGLTGLEDDLFPLLGGLEDFQLLD